MSNSAVGAPGASPTWSSSDKDFITTSLGTSRLWATIGHGIVNEVYWPSTGSPQIRDLSVYLVGEHGWRDLKRLSRYTLSTPAPCVSLLTVIHTGDDYELVLEILPDPRRDVLLIRYAIKGPYRLVAIVAPHLGGTGTANHAWIDGDAAFAQRGGASLCFRGSEPLSSLSCGYVGVWPRDATLSAMALLGANQVADVTCMLGHLIAMQTSEGDWPQNYGITRAMND